MREQGVIDLPTGIRMLTRAPAEFYSLNDRGLIAEGMKADLNIFDFERLQLRTPHIVHDLPAGYSIKIPIRGPHPPGGKSSTTPPIKN